MIVSFQIHGGVVQRITKKLLHCPNTYVPNCIFNLNRALNAMSWCAGVIQKQHEGSNIEWISIANRIVMKLLYYSFNEKKSSLNEVLKDRALLGLRLNFSFTGAMWEQNRELPTWS